jgi:hypothetical protein
MLNEEAVGVFEILSHYLPWNTENKYDEHLRMQIG